jgi:hypothetical protein
MTNWTEINTFENILTSANTYAPFWTGILLMLWVVLVVTFLPFGATVAFIGGSFSAFLIGLLLAYIGLVTWKVVLIMVGVILLLIIVGGLTAKKEQ